VASSGGVLSEKIGWGPFFLLTSVVGLPAILLIFWIGPRDDFGNRRSRSALEGAGDTSAHPIPARKL